MAPLAWAAKKRPLPSAPRVSRRLRKRASLQPSRLDLGLAFRTLLHKKTRPSHPDEGYTITISVSESGTASKRELAKSRREGVQWKKSELGAETLLTMKRTQAK